jgi:cytochrome c oxidase subunit III
MNVMLLFLAAIGAVIAWWLAGQRLFSKPWLETGTLPIAEGQDHSTAIAKIGLYVFLAVVGALFSLFISAYLMRMAATDWWAMPIPGLLWANTCVLALGSITLEWARREVRIGRLDVLRLALATACASIALFVFGQVQAWRELMAAGYRLADNPSNSFFYMLTGLHGLHMLGGLVVIGRTGIRSLAPNAKAAGLSLSVDLCAVYCHFMLVVWLVLFALFAGWANDFAEICRQLIT